MLLKEALLLSQQIAKTDKQVEEEIRARNGMLASYIHDLEEGNPVAFKIGEKAADKLNDKYGTGKIEEKIQGELIRLLAKAAKIAIPSVEKGFKIAGFGWSVISQLLEPTNKDDIWKKQLYFDDHVQMGLEYEAKVKRLAEITKILMSSAPLQSWDLNSTCEIHQCYKTTPLQ